MRTSMSPLTTRSSFSGCFRHWKKVTRISSFSAIFSTCGLRYPATNLGIHRRFLSWCGAQKKYRRIGFIEGNHEYFLAEERRDFFTWCSDGPYHRDGKGNLFCHGDQVNRRDRNYLRFRKMAKNGLTKTVLRLMPFGPEFVEQLKARLEAHQF